MHFFVHRLIRYLRGSGVGPMEPWHRPISANYRVAVLPVALLLVAGHAPLKVSSLPAVSEDSGRAVYVKACAMCHDEYGMGRPPYGTRLVGSQWLSTCRTDQLVAVMLDGIHGPIDGSHADYPVMPALRTWLSDREFASVGTEVLERLSGRSDRVSEALVRAVRERQPQRASPWSVEELKAQPRPVFPSEGQTYER